MNREQFIQYISDEYGIDGEYLWASSPLSCAFRHPGNRKWFALVEYTGALKAPVRCFGNHLSGKGKSSFQTDNECGGAAILKK